MGLIAAIYFMLPAYFANMAPIFVRKINFLNYPIDNGKKFKGKRILGKNKTWRGIFFGILLGTIVYLIQGAYYSDTSALNLTDYNIWIGILLSAGAIIGDSVKSFFKRRKNLHPGATWLFFDQTDFVFGALIFVSPIFVPVFLDIIYIIVASIILHVIANYVGYLSGVRKQKW